jgi:5-(carboxyamino)imidazole ribonucleotide mutase
VKKRVQVVVVMGSKSDLSIMKEATEALSNFNIVTHTEILSAHRTPELLEREVRNWEEAGVKIIIAGAGGAAHLPGMLAAFSNLPVIGVPISSAVMNGLDSLLSIAQMPRGVPVASVAVNGAYNAGLLPSMILAADDQSLKKKVVKYKTGLNLKVLEDRKHLSKLGIKHFLRL